jgi:hypothetical protein
VFEEAKRPSLARAQNTEERKAPRNARQGIRVAFSLVRFLDALRVLLATQKK